MTQPIEINTTVDSKNIVNRFDNIGMILLSLFASSLPFEIQFSYLGLLAISIFILIRLFKLRDFQIPSQMPIFQIVYLLALAGYFFSFDFYRANYILERQLTILLFPILMPFVTNFSNLKINRILLGLTIGNIIAIIFLYYHAFNDIFEKNLGYKAILTEAYLNHKFSLPLNIHAGYLSMYVSLSVFYVINCINKNKHLLYNILLLIALAILFSGLVSLAARNTIITTSIICIFIYPLFAMKNRLMYFILVSFSCISIIYFLNKSPYYKSRFASEFMKEITLNKVKLIDSYEVEPRMQRWLCAIDLIKEKPIIGYGTGDEVLLLKQEYYEKHLIVSYNLKFNAHNQYLSIAIRHGIIGLIIFILAFGYYFLLGIKSKFFIYISFLILLTVGFFTENIMDANKGIFFFAFFNTLFGYTILAQRKKEKDNLHTSTI